MTSRAGLPVILAACEDPGDMQRIERELRARYEADHRVVLEGSAATGLEALRGLGEDGDRVALVLADQQMREMSGVEFLGRVREVHPTAKRLLLTTRMERSGGTVLPPWPPACPTT